MAAGEILEEEAVILEEEAVIQEEEGAEETLVSPMTNSLDNNL